MKVYVVYYSFFDDFHIEAVTHTRDHAERLVALLNTRQDNNHDYEEYDTDDAYQLESDLRIKRERNTTRGHIS